MLLDRDCSFFGHEVVSYYAVLGKRRSMKTASPFRYVGGKTRLYPNILNYLPDPEDVNGYYEPFVGSGAVFFLYGHLCENAYLNDICQPLMNAYSELKCVSTLDPWDRPKYEECLFDLMENSYEEIKIEFNEARTPGGFVYGPHCAALFIALNHLCFNGIWRENKKGLYNVPVGKNSKGEPRTLVTLDFDKLDAAGNKLKNAFLSATSFDEWASKHTLGKRDVGLFDPPYANEFSQYNKDGFTLDNHKSLAAYCRASADNGATVIVCGSNNQASWDIYGEPTEVIELSRTVGHSKRAKATEALYVYTQS
jgi:DNA adenine methylase